MIDFNVAMPELGEAAFLSFDMEAMEKLYETFGNEYLATIGKGIDRCDVVVFRACIETMLRGVEIDVSAAMNQYAVKVLATRIADAVSVRTRGVAFSAVEPA